MWKYVSRRIRDSIERSANYFDRRSATLTNNPNNWDKGYDANNRNEESTPCCWYKPIACWKQYHGSNANNKRWNFEQLNNSWLGAITWSSGLVLGWYANQLIQLKHIYHKKDERKKCCPIGCNALDYIKPFADRINNKKSLLYEPIIQVEQAIDSRTPTVHLISNDHGESSPQKQRTVSDSSSKTESSENDLGEVLNSIENRLGLAAIENGQHQEGLNLLRSAATRNHPPALYNLGLCYETGLGVKADEKAAMELYRSAAALEHSGAMFNLGVYYGQGRGGLTRDTGMATRLLRLAAVKGNQDAVKALKSLEEDIQASPVELNVNKYMPYGQNDVFVPTQTSLFVDSINSLCASTNCEYQVY